MDLKGEVAKFVYTLVFNEKSIERKRIVPILFNLQKNYLIPIAPFRISRNGDIQSEIIDLILDDFISMRYFAQENGVIRVTTRSLELFEKFLQNLPSKDPFCFVKPKHPDISSFRMAIGKSNFDIKLQASFLTRGLTKALPVMPELGAIFSMPMNIYLFKKAIPLYYEKDGIETSYALAPSGKIDLTLNNHHKNLKKAKSLVRQTLGETSLDLKALNNAFRILLLSLFPLSSTTIEYICKNGHIIDFKPYDRHISAVLATPPGKCKDCYGIVDKAIFVVDNEKIFVDWKNGALMEWFASELLKLCGFTNVLWNFEINGVQCDALAFDKNYVVIIECKRTFDYSKIYYQGIEKLRQLRELLESSSLEIKTVIMTTIRDQPRQEEAVNTTITCENFFRFSTSPLLFLQT